VNVDFQRKIIKVRERLDSDKGDVRIKDRAERSVPLADDLAESLQALKLKRPNTRLVLGTSNDTPNDKMLQLLKRCVRKAGLNCGHCSGCRGTQECSRWKIKTFRSTYCSQCLRAGVDPRTLMQWTGHEDLATLLKYLAASRDPNLQQRVSAIQWT
jgi:integrase